MPGYNPPIAHYCHISVSHLNDTDILKIIGKSGYFFKKITEDCNANYIWWNKENKVIEIIMYIYSWYMNDFYFNLIKYEKYEILFVIFLMLFIDYYNYM